MDQEVPASVGRASFRATLRAIPVPLLVTVTVNPTASTADTALSLHDALPILAAPRTSTEAEAVSDPSLVVVTLAVLSTGEEIGVAAVLSAVTGAAWMPPPAWYEEPQLRVPPAMAQVV